MIGQKTLLSQIDWMCKANCFPRFCIIVGDAGSEKLQLANYIAKQLKCFQHGVIDNKIDTVRAIIDESYKTHAPIVYIFNNADDMSVPAKNALLKVTEEPPNNAFFVMILEDLNNTLDTIRSRAVTFTMEHYSKQELTEYINTMYPFCDDAEKDILFALCETPGDIDSLVKQGTANFYAYVAKVVDNIAEVRGANSFKIAEKVALKDEEDKYDLKLFWKACCKLFYDKAKTVDYIPYLKACNNTSNSLKKLAIRGVNKQMLFDEWILKVREVLR